MLVALADAGADARGFDHKRAMSSAVGVDVHLAAEALKHTVDRQQPEDRACFEQHLATRGIDHPLAFRQAVSDQCVIVIVIMVVTVVIVIVMLVFLF
jgi:hypothetical protein